MHNSPNSKTCLLTGASGYLGGRIRQKLESEGWKVVPMSRRASGGSIPFRLGEDVDPCRLTGASALVHCAYDFEAIFWPQLCAANVEGSRKLLAAAKSAGVNTLVFISSISAFEGCRSLYGRAKLEVERITHSLGGTVIRPGLVYGEEPGAMFGKLVALIRRSPVVPLPGTGNAIQYLVHDSDLAEVILRCVEENVSQAARPITVAHPEPWRFRDVLCEIARALGKRVVLAPFPWQIVWATLKIAELGGLHPRFRSDSLTSLLHQNPSPSFAELQSAGVQCRRFQFHPFPQRIQSGECVRRS